MPDSTLSYKYTRLLYGSKKAMDHITVLCFPNLSGTDKWKLLVGSKIAMCWPFKSPAMDGLLVLYYANKNAWMTSEMFKKWLMSLDMELQWNSREVLLLFQSISHPLYIQEIHTRLNKTTRYRTCHQIQKYIIYIPYQSICHSNKEYINSIWGIKLKLIQSIQ